MRKHARHAASCNESRSAGGLGTRHFFFLGLLTGSLGLCAGGASADEGAAGGTPPPLLAQQSDTTSAQADRPKSGAPSDEGSNKSYVIPAAEIFGFDFLLNQFDRHVLGDDYKSNFSTIRRNLGHGWVVDNDPYAVNQIGHPYQGSMYHGFARSSGLNFWESLGYTFAGSVLWEIAGENTLPSKNDQVASGIAGSFFGESLFRMAHLLLESEARIPQGWKEFGAAVISPSTGFNRFVYGTRYDHFASHDPYYYSRLQIGASGTTQSDPGTSTKLKRNEALIDFSMDYGLPGNTDYTYKRPFDYFNLQATASSANGFESVLSRGLLVGKDYQAGKNYRGVGGLYGSYDYIAPQVFRVSSTALSLGTTAEWWLTRSIALQGTGLFGAGYAAASTIHGAGERDYHYGIAPQALLALRLIFGNRASLDLEGREYFVTRVLATDSAGKDNIFRGEVTFTVRVAGNHGIAVKYLVSRRDASYPDLGDRTQTRGTLGIFYTLLGRDGFSAVGWKQ